MLSAVSTPEAYNQELEELYRMAKRLLGDIMFVGLTPVLEAETRPWIFNTGIHALEWNNDRIRLFDDTLKAFTQSYSLPYVALFDEMLKQMDAGASLMMDGLHPNAEGHRVMYAQIKKHLPIDIKKF